MDFSDYLQCYRSDVSYCNYVFIVFLSTLAHCFYFVPGAAVRVSWPCLSCSCIVICHICHVIYTVFTKKTNTVYVAITLANNVGF